MTDEDSIHNDEMEEPLDEDETEDSDLADEDDDGGLTASPAGGSSKAAAEIIDDFSIASRQKVRDELDAQIAEFLARGGVISEVPANVTTDPPKKPAPDYGGRPI